MATRTYAVRLAATGAAEIRQTLESTGQAGKKAFDDIGAAADRAAASTEKLTAKTNEAGTAARAAPTGPAPTGPAAPAAPAQVPSAPTSETTRKEVERLRLRLDDDFRNQRQRDRDAAVIGRSGLSDTEASRLRYLSEKRYAVNDNKSEGLNTYDKLFVKYQGMDFIQQIASGQSPGRAAFQQGEQIFQQLSDREGGVTKGLQQLAVSARGLVTPFSVAGVAVTAAAGTIALAAYQAAQDQKTLQAATQGLGRSTGASVGRLEDMAQRNAEAGKVSTSTAREIAAAYASTGTVALPAFDTLIQKTSRYAELTKQDIPSATAELARAFADPARGVDDLAGKIGAFDDVTRQNIVTLAEQGDKMGASTALAAALKTQIEANTVSVGGLAGAWDRAKAAADGYWEAGKRAVSLRLQRYGLGDGPTASQSEVDKLNEEIAATNKTRAFTGLGPLTYQTSEKVRRRDDMLEVIERDSKKAVDAAFQDQARKDSVTAAAIGRGSDPLTKVYDDLVQKRDQINRSLDNPSSRSSLTDIPQVERERDRYNDAINSMIGANGKLITSDELVRRQDDLRIRGIKAKGDATKEAAIAEEQKRLDLIGKVVGDRAGQVSRAGDIARLEASSKGGKEDRDDEYDRMLKSTADRIRRQDEEATTFGQSADAVARYRTEIELMTAAERAGRDVTPELREQIQKVADDAGAAAKRMEDLKESSKRADDIRGVGSDGVRTLVRDLADGARQGKILEDVLGSIKSRATDLLSTSITDALFGKRGSTEGGITSLLASFFGGRSGKDSPTGGANVAGAPGFLTSIASIFGFADGGLVYGPGGPREDRVVARLSPGEYVVNAESAARHRDLLDVINRGSVPRFAYGGLAPGRDDLVGRDRFTMPSAAATRPANDSGPPSITFVTPPGMALEAEGPPRRSAGGGYEQVLRSVDAGLGKRAREGRGSFAQTNGGPAFRQG